MTEGTDHAKVRAVFEKSLVEGIGGISSLALSYAKPYIPQICGKQQEDLWTAGYMIVPRVHVDALKKGK
jgi:hypothetical protein